ncbi:3alpha-hydroxy bile acid-CoA-ester 3-dehydrogenase 1/3 [Parachlamydia sp. AcF125]|nr:SDR family NAD(P)-dependent oxidoreductase [Parachlamydia sp. AcF125]MBS4167519.1 3alpha-hydroxy bile acid-CoA-ester 3-dehydrogenase 1/3 [Parachlamydia sp. AcF125]
MTKKFEGKIAIITGGNSGLGLAIAQLFVAESAFMSITGRRQKELDRLLSSLALTSRGFEKTYSN